jgi:hypothetical protein
MAKAFGLGRDRAKTATIESLANELAYLEANHAEMTVAELRARRNAAIASAVLLGRRSLGPSRNRVHELVLAFDRVGY